MSSAFAGPHLGSLLPLSSIIVHIRMSTVILIVCMSTFMSLFPGPCYLHGCCMIANLLHLIQGQFCIRCACYIGGCAIWCTTIGGRWLWNPFWPLWPMAYCLLLHILPWQKPTVHNFPCLQQSSPKTNTRCIHLKVQEFRHVKKFHTGSMFDYLLNLVIQVLVNTVP